MHKKNTSEAPGEVSFLPPAFELIPRLLVLLDDPESDTDALAQTIRVDAGLTADILHIANNPIFAGETRTETLREAITRLGLREIYRIVMHVLTSAVMANPEQKGLERIDLWNHSLASAIGAQILSQETGLENPEIAFTAGLLHDIGKVVLVHSGGAKYIELIERCKAGRLSFHEEERRLFQSDHAEAGAELLQRWNFPEKIVGAVAGHQVPAASPASHAILAALAHAGNILAYRTHHGYNYPDYAVAPDPAHLALIGLTPDMLDPFEQRVMDDLDREQARFR